MISTARINTTGVTVGVGPLYARLALIAAACFGKHTGLPTVILGEKELRECNISHPAALRLRLFDYVATDRVIYFDADWLCLGEWTPWGFGETSEVLACRDFILTDEWPQQHYNFKSNEFLEEPVEPCLVSSSGALRHDYISEVQQFAGIGLPCYQWINTGLLIMHRKHHSLWLKTALDFYLGSIGHHDVYYEQPALVKALECLELRVRLLPRRFNVLATHEAKWPASVVGLHIKVKRHNAFITKIESGTISTPNDIENYFLEQ